MRPLAFLSRRSAALVAHAAFATCSLLAALAPADAAAQQVTASCAARAAADCTALRFDFAASEDAPWALHAFTAVLDDGWTFGDGVTAAFTGEDALSDGIPFTGSAPVVGRSLFVDFLTSPGSPFELVPGGTGWLQVGVRGAGTPGVAVTARDPDGGETGGVLPVPGVPTSTVPEPSSALLVAAGAVALAGAVRRRGMRSAAHPATRAASV